MIGTPGLTPATPEFCDCGARKVSTYRGLYDCPVCTTVTAHIFDDPEEIPLHVAYPNRAARRAKFRRGKERAGVVSE